MKTNVTFSEIVNQLYKVFSNEAEASQYTNTQSGAQYMGLCGWAGTMSPLNRAAFLQEFGQDVTDRAEREARARVAEYRAAYEASEYHRHELEAGEADPDQVPAVGSFVFGWTDWLKCEGGPMDPLKNHVNDWGSLRPELVEIAAVVEVEPAEFLSAETAHRIAREHQNHGGSRYNEADPLRLDGDPYAWTVGVLVVCRAYGDGEKSQTPARWYVVDSEGYDWARYILMPQRFASMYAEEIADLRAQRAAVEAQKAAEEEAAKAARLADYRARCARWEGAGLVDVRPLIAAESAAYGTREKSQIRSASAKLLAARRKNIATFIAAAFPGVKFSIRANNGWGAAYRISWTDGPTVETFRASTDVDLLFTTGEYYSNQDDSYDYDRKEFIDFAEKFMGFTRGGFDCDRHESQEFRDEIAARIREAVPGLPESDQAQIPEADALEVAEAADIISGDRAHRSRVVDMAERWGLLDVVAYVARITDRPTTSEASTDPTPDNGGTGAAYGDSEKSQTQEAPDGLTLEEIPGGVAVVGDSRATYKARREIKAHGARWNKAAQRWEATDAEAVESLRQWLTPAPVADATPTEEAAPVAYGEAEKSQPQSEADRARVRLEEIRASIEAEAVSYGEIAELQNELRPYIAPDDLQLLEWASPEEEPQELPAPPAAVVYDPEQPVERAEFHTIEEAPAVAASLPMDADNPEASAPTGAAYGEAEKSQLSAAVASLIAQYAKLKAKHPEAVALFRVCNFYAAYFEDAQKVADVCGLIVSRNQNGTPCATFPAHALDTYLPKLVRAGLKVCIVDHPTLPTGTDSPTKGSAPTDAPTEAPTHQDTPTAAPEAAPGAAYGDSQKSQDFEIRPEVEALRQQARRAGTWTSFDPDKLGDGLIADLEHSLRAFESKLPEEVRAEKVAAYIAKWREWLAARSRCISSAITGPARFPVARAQKLNEYEQAAWKRLQDWAEKVVRRCNAEQRLTGWDEVERLTAKAEKLEQLQESMKEANKILRQRISEVEKYDALVALGFSEQEAQEIMTPDYIGRVGFASFQLSNNLAKIKDTRNKIARHAALAKCEDRSVEYVWGTLEYSFSDERYRLHFPGKPSDDILTFLKSHGWKWSRANGAWQRQITAGARYNLKQFIEKFGGKAE